MSLLYGHMFTGFIMNFLALIVDTWEEFGKREGGRLMQTAAIALIVVLLVGMACGLEITWALGLSCIAAVLLDPKLTFVVIAQRIFANSNSFSMLAIPAFMLAGDVMSKGGLSKRLVAFADSSSAGSPVESPWYLSLPAHSLQQFPVPLLLQQRPLAD